MQIPIYQVDAFARSVFTGNPAAVCILDSWPEDAVLAGIAAENYLSETAFLVKQNPDNQDSHYLLRWFTPQLEVDLCGHATLASAYVAFEFLGHTGDSVKFSTLSGELLVTRDASQRLCMNFPARAPQAVDVTPLIAEAMGQSPEEALLSRDLLLVYRNEQQLRSLQPDMQQLMQIPDALGVIATAAGDEADFVSRFFAPKAGVPEDPVTGSAHCTLIPHWAGRLNKNALYARQISSRGGELWCEYQGDRVMMSGYASLYMTGTINF